MVNNMAGKSLQELIDELCPDGVEYKTLSSVAKLITGATPSTSNKDYWDNGTIPWMSSGEVNNKQVYSTEKKITQVGYDNTSTTIVPCHTVVIALAGQGKTRGKVAITEIELCTNQSLCSIVCNDEINYKYLYFYLDSKYEELRAISNGDGTRGGLSLRLLNPYEIPVPPLPVQEEIVHILDKFTELTSELQANLADELTARKQQYEYYRDELLTFGDEVEWKPLNDFCTVITKQTGFDYSNSIKASLIGERKNNTLPYIQTKFFAGKVFDFNTDYFIPKEVAYNFPKILLNEKCLLFSIVGASIGNVGLFDGSVESFLGGAICVAKFKENVNAEFVYHCAVSSIIQQQIRKKTKGAGQATVTIEDIRNFVIPVPSKVEQARIVALLDRFDALCNDITAGLPAEIEARQKQYEYYRDKLLSFRRK